MNKSLNLLKINIALIVVSLFFANSSFASTVDSNQSTSRLVDSAVLLLDEFGHAEMQGHIKEVRSIPGFNPDYFIVRKNAMPPIFNSEHAKSVKLLDGENAYLVKHDNGVDRTAYSPGEFSIPLTSETGDFQDFFATPWRIEITSDHKVFFSAKYCGDRSPGASEYRVGRIVFTQDVKQNTFRMLLKASELLKNVQDIIRLKPSEEQAQ